VFAAHLGQPVEPILHFRARIVLIGQDFLGRRRSEGLRRSRWPLLRNASTAQQSQSRNEEEESFHRNLQQTVWSLPSKDLTVKMPKTGLATSFGIERLRGALLVPLS
jgi:hypothetical protein